MVDSALVGLGLAGWFGGLAVAEQISARRSARAQSGTDARLFTNFALGALVLAMSSLLPLAKIGSSALGQSLGAGFVPGLGLPWGAVLGVLVMGDSLAAYWTHRLMHAAPLLWRVHRVHHADNAVDISTSLRNHPLELMVTVPTSAAVILIIGAPPSVVVAAQTVAFAAAIWQHADVDLPEWLDHALVRVLVTPAFHRLHHNPDRRLHDSNYGELVTLWDRLFGTSNLSNGLDRVGLDGQAARPDGLLAQICSPLYAASSAAPLNVESL